MYYYSLGESEQFRERKRETREREEKSIKFA